MTCWSAGAPARAADASAWDSGPYSAMRLIAGRSAERAGAPRLRAGVEIKLQPGWKTYWRYPGDSGVPPRFDFSGSRNVKDVRVLWPAPMRFADGGGTSVGYAERVVLPLHVEPADASAPTLLRLNLDYAVCEKLCVPVEARAEIALPARAGGHDEVLAASEARAPRRVAAGAAGRLSIVAVRKEAGQPPRIIVDVKAPPGPLDLLAEGPNPEWSLPLPDPVEDAPAGLRRFAFDLAGLPAGATAKGAALTLTAISADAAIEVVTHLD